MMITMLMKWKENKVNFWVKVKYWENCNKASEKIDMICQL